MPYISLTINPTKVANPYNNQTSQIYKGFSTVDNAVASSTLYDQALIKQDLINQLNVSQGEKLMDPKYGTVIWKLLFEPFTEGVKTQIITDFTRIINSDPRAFAKSVEIFEQEYGLLIQATLQYVLTNQTEVLKLGFDGNIGLVTKQ